MYFFRKSLVCLNGITIPSSLRAGALEEAKARMSVNSEALGIAPQSVNGPYTRTSGAVSVKDAGQADEVIFTTDDANRDVSISNELESRPPGRNELVSVFNSQTVRFALSLALAMAVQTTALATITLVNPGQVTLPSVTVSQYAQTVYSGDHVLTLKNTSVKDGWILTGEVVNNLMQGASTGESVFAELSFKSITWVSGGQGSSAGITIYPDGKRIEADPGFGRGTYEIVFEVRIEIPPFPAADQYIGVSTFIIQ